ncbi:ABC transporter ATP-binding protein [bacterium]|nr:ABC transporter ATP-binding protein [bacterium]
MPNQSTPVLELKGLHKCFQGLTAVSKLDLNVFNNEIIGLIGPNGAGKSTVLNMIGGTLKPTKGHIFFNGKEISQIPAHKRAKIGISRVFQANVLFRNFSVLDNVLVGMHLQSKVSLFRVLFQRKVVGKEENKLRHKAELLLASVGLDKCFEERACNLPHGHQRILALAVAMAVNPRLILLDEPFTGMTDSEVITMMDLVKKLRIEQNITCIIIEHNLKAVMGLCDRLSVLNFGGKIAEGTPDEIFNNPIVTEAYLGREEEEDVA